MLCYVNGLNGLNTIMVLDRKFIIDCNLQFLFVINKHVCCLYKIPSCVQLLPML